jgi:hypothetical protein
VLVVSALRELRSATHMSLEADLADQGCVVRWILRFLCWNSGSARKRFAFEDEV